tara:strand:+ start:358 stop:1365 length:1008 start_codon:yes stop_codon:yes gene_type:complete
MTLLSFPRQIGLKRAICLTENDFNQYINRLKTLSSTYTSLYAFDSMISGRKVDYDSAIMDRAWWDFDVTNELSMEQVKTDVAILINRLEGDVRAVATGRGFHVHQLFDTSVIGRDWAAKLDTYEKKMAEGLISLDGVGYPEKLARVPDTYNPKRGKWAVTIDAREFAKDPFAYKIPKVPDASLMHMNPFSGISVDVRFSLTRWHRDNKPSEKEVSFAPTGLPEGTKLLSSTVPLPTCLERAITVSNPPHHVRVALGQHMAAQLRWYAEPSDLTRDQLQSIEDEICLFIGTLNWSDYKPSITRKAVKSLLKYKRYPSPAWYRKNNLCDGVNCWYCC